MFFLFPKFSNSILYILFIPILGIYSNSLCAQGNNFIYARIRPSNIWVNYHYLLIDDTTTYSNIDPTPPKTIPWLSVENEFECNEVSDWRYLVRTLKLKKPYMLKLDTETSPPYNRCFRKLWHIRYLGCGDSRCENTEDIPHKKNVVVLFVNEVIEKAENLEYFKKKYKNIRCLYFPNCDYSIKVPPLSLFPKLQMVQIYLPVDTLPEEIVNANIKALSLMVGIDRDYYYNTDISELLLHGIRPHNYYIYQLAKMDLEYLSIDAADLSPYELRALLTNVHKMKNMKYFTIKLPYANFFGPPYSDLYDYTEDSSDTRLFKLVDFFQLLSHIPFVGIIDTYGGNFILPGRDDNGYLLKKTDDAR